MLSNAEMFKLSNEIAHQNAVPPVEQRTQYVIKLTKPGAYVRARRTYTLDAAQASRFDFMTTALIFAFEILELAPEEFDVECVA